MSGVYVLSLVLKRPSAVNSVALNDEDLADVPDLFLSELSPDGAEDAYLSAAVTPLDDGTLRVDVWMDYAIDRDRAAHILEKSGLTALHISVSEETATRDSMLDAAYDDDAQEREEFSTRYFTVIRTSAPNAAVVKAEPRRIHLWTPHAFGDGFHPTTRLCLEALEKLANDGVLPASESAAAPFAALDVGTGSGLLALAAHVLWGCRVCATEVEPQAVQTAKDNWLRNGFDAAHLTAVLDGDLSAACVKESEFSLVMANILKGPLIGLSPALAAVQAQGGLVVLSGFLEVQEADLLTAYEALGYGVYGAAHRDGWGCAVLRRQKN